MSYSACSVVTESSSIRRLASVANIGQAGDVILWRVSGRKLACSPKVPASHTRASEACSIVNQRVPAGGYLS
jgi:hypothetical protein